MGLCVLEVGLFSQASVLHPPCGGAVLFRKWSWGNSSSLGQPQRPSSFHSEARSLACLLLWEREALGRSQLAPCESTLSAPS